MRAVVFRGRPGEVVLEHRDVPEPGDGELLLRVRACGVCRTDLHVVDGDLPIRDRPIVPGHQVVGEVVRGGGVEPGVRVGVPWLGWTCGVCEFCVAEAENLCEQAAFTGYDRDGGLAEFCVADARFCFPVPPGYPDEQAAPLLCAGLIGHRALRMAGAGRRLGLYGFGAAAHIVAQEARYEGRDVYAFTRPGDVGAQAFARGLGAVWAGGSDDPPPQALDAAIIFAPVGALVPTALGAVRRGGRVVCAGIHMSTIPAFSYDLLWGERSLVSVANLTRRDGEEFLALAPEVPIQTRVTCYGLADAGRALDDLRAGRIEGAAVVVP